MKTLLYITLIVGASLLSGCGQVETGEAGFFTRWGKIISTEPLSDGLHFYMPIGTDLIVYDIKIFSRCSLNNKSLFGNNGKAPIFTLLILSL